MANKLKGVNFAVLNEINSRKKKTCCSYYVEKWLRMSEFREIYKVSHDIHHVVIFMTHSSPLQIEIEIKPLCGM